MVVWLVTIGDQERNFRRKRDAVAWLLRLTHDERPTPAVHRETRSRYCYYGPGEDLTFVTRAWIDRLGFPPLRFYAPKTRVRKKRAAQPASLGSEIRKKRREQPVSADAIDPCEGCDDKLTTRETKGVF